MSFKDINLQVFVTFWTILHRSLYGEASLDPGKCNTVWTLDPM